MISVTRGIHSVLLPRTTDATPVSRADAREHEGSRLRCPVCDDVIGVYEPIVVLEPGGLRHTSILNEPMLDSDQIVMHRACAQNTSSPLAER